jgi:hypothetical protein
MSVLNLIDVDRLAENRIGEVMEEGRGRYPNLEPAHLVL